MAASVDVIVLIVRRHSDSKFHKVFINRFDSVVTCAFKRVVAGIFQREGRVVFILYFITSYYVGGGGGCFYFIFY